MTNKTSNNVLPIFLLLCSILFAVCELPQRLQSALLGSWWKMSSHCDVSRLWKCIIFLKYLV